MHVPSILRPLNNNFGCTQGPLPAFARPEDKELSDDELSVLEKQVGVLNSFSQDPLRAPDLQVLCCDRMHPHVHIHFYRWEHTHITHTRSKLKQYACVMQHTPLGDYLSCKAKSVSPREVVVKVVADVLKEPRVRFQGNSVDGGAGGGLPFRSKAIFAFQRVDDSAHFVMCFG
jgi:hypothetical protein